MQVEEQNAGKFRLDNILLMRLALPKFYRRARQSGAPQQKEVTMRGFSKFAITAAAATIAFAGSAGVAGAALPFADLGTGSLGSLSSLFPAPEQPDPEQPAPEEGPTVTASKLTGLVDGEKITVSGEGFSGENFGIYVGLAQDDQYSATDASKFLSTQWVKAASIVDGEWSVELDVVAANAENGSDCTVNACSIYTLSAHGNPDRTQDTKTPVTFQK